MRQHYEADTSGDGDEGAGPRQQRDYSLKEGQTLRIALPDKVHAEASPRSPRYLRHDRHGLTSQTAGSLGAMPKFSIVCEKQCAKTHEHVITSTFANAPHAGREGRRRRPRQGANRRQSSAAEPSGLRRRCPAAAAAAAAGGPNDHIPSSECFIRWALLPQHEDVARKVRTSRYK